MKIDYYELIGAIVGAIVVGLLSSVIDNYVSRVFEGIRQRLDRRRQENKLDPPEGTEPGGLDTKNAKGQPETPQGAFFAFVRKYRRVVWIGAIILGGYVGFLAFSSMIRDAGAVEGSDTREPLAFTATPSSDTAADAPAAPLFPPTPVPYGDLLYEINFASRGEGDCNDYNPDHMGYADKQYYIDIGTYEGFLAVCHDPGDVPPGAALQVTAAVEGAPAAYGYGVLFGWQGGQSTTDACVFGILHENGDVFAKRIEWVDGTPRSSIAYADDVALDHNPHVLRVVMDENGLAQGFLDGVFFAEHQFAACGDGPIGVMAWGEPGTRVHFDDLKLHEVP